MALADHESRAEVNMNKPDHIVLANQFRGLTFDHQPLLLPTAWDGASARILEKAGFPAIGTTSGGIANARGVPDGERMGRDTMVREIKAIADAVAVPVSADIEAGYGDTPADVVETVNAVLDLGVVGINLEDRDHRGRRLREQENSGHQSFSNCPRPGISTSLIFPDSARFRRERASGATTTSSST
jgi:hypothetical protein